MLPSLIKNLKKEQEKKNKEEQEKKNKEEFIEDDDWENKFRDASKKDNKVVDNE